jgi:hypothetical protein
MSLLPSNEAEYSWKTVAGICFTATTGKAWRNGAFSDLADEGVQAAITMALRIKSAAYIKRFVGFCFDIRACLKLKKFMKT